MLGYPRVLPDIVEEHLDELEFLWELREAGLFSPDWNLRDLAEHEERAEAHLDGLRLSGPSALELARERLGGEGTSATAAAAMVLHEGGGAEDLEPVLTVLRKGEPEDVEGVRLGLRQFHPATLEPSLREILGHEEALRAAAAAHLLSFWRLPVENLERLLDQEDPPTRILALGVAARLGALHPRAIASGVEAPDRKVRRAALEAAALLGVPGLPRHCRSAGSREVDPDPEAIRFLGIVGETGDVALLQSLLRGPELGLDAVAALGALGRVEAIPILLELMGDEALGGAAALAYQRITGAEDLQGEEPPPSAEAAEEEDEPALPHADPAKARADWEARRGSMSPKASWQLGRPVDPGPMLPHWEELTLEARRDLYLRLRARGERSVPDLELEALARRQTGPGGPLPQDGGA